MSTVIETSPQRVRADRSVWTATGLEPQVFLDRSGRRAGRVRVGGAVAALAASAWLGGIVSGASGFATLPPLVSATLAARPGPALLAPPHHRGTIRLAAVRPRTADRS